MKREEACCVTTLTWGTKLERTSILAAEKTELSSRSRTYNLS